MKYCLNSEVSDIYLRQADEILLQDKTQKIATYLEEYPNATIIVWSSGSPEEWDMIQAYYNSYDKRIKVELQQLGQAEECVRRNLPFIYLRPITTYAELNTLNALGCSDVRVDGPLFFDLKQVKNRTNMNIRVCPNKRHTSINRIPLQNPAHGTWIRPEDIFLYEDLIDIIELDGIDPTAEGTAFKIYAEKKEWNSDLHFIIPEVPLGVNNLTFMADLIMDHRLTCQQSCERLGGCRICDRAINMNQKLHYENGKLRFT